ncbi:MAG: biopolymer transporter ExbD [Arenimonas sp.]|nr:biopolymer transporter ExbD [Arenimonas sp.]MBP6309642.1 biopolymer transporter ExbD [Arenimonas sp.]
MAFSSNSSGGDMADMNVTPLVDVMLVLLIIFMVTAPPLSYQIQVDLPQKSTIPPPEVLNPPEPIRIHVQTGGTVAWNGSPVPMETLQAQFDVEGARDVQPTIEITTDPDAEYETLAKVLARTKNSGLLKISFVEDVAP